MTAVILQARLDSSRLPEKSLLPLEGKPLVFRVMQALKRVRADRYILACPEDCVSAFSALADEAGFTLSPGPKENVLSRYCIAIRRFGVDRIIRATADNPFVFADAAESINREAEEQGADYAAYYGLPHGAGVESIRAEALFRAEAEVSLDAEKEHVCPYLYAHPERFLLHRPLAPREWRSPLARLTVDTKEDYHAAEKLFIALSASSGPAERYRGAVIIGAYRRIFGASSPASAVSAGRELFV
jgi:spore coat polysaccharide biosynthesis protein SpsF